MACVNSSLIWNNCWSKNCERQLRVAVNWDSSWTDKSFAHEPDKIIKGRSHAKLSSVESAQCLLQEHHPHHRASWRIDSFFPSKVTRVTCIYTKLQTSKRCQRVPFHVVAKRFLVWNNRHRRWRLGRMGLVGNIIASSRLIISLKHKQTTEGQKGKQKRWLGSYKRWL